MNTGSETYPMSAAIVEIDISGRLHRRTRADEVLDKLRRSGERGITATDFPPGVRLAAIIHRLKQRGHRIVTLHERHGGAHPGRHGRYVLIGEAC
jgi:hypothetical protein